MNNIQTTPQRPQKQRRTRHTTMSDESLISTPKFHSTQSSSSLRPNFQQQRRTPQQQQRQSVKLQRQHSVSCCTPTGKLTPPQFMRLQKATGGSGSQASLFAGSKFMESPAPEAVPMPPIHWFSTDLSTPSRARVSPTPSSISDSLSSTSSLESTGSSSDEMLSMAFDGHHRGGFRVNPMQLIATISALA